MDDLNSGLLGEGLQRPGLSVPYPCQFRTVILVAARDWRGIIVVAAAASAPVPISPSVWRLVVVIMLVYPSLSLLARN
jgi:hypothetical protein